MKKAFNVVFKIFEYFSALTLAVMVALMFMQVLFRFVFHSPLAWTEELARYTFIWSTFIASCVAAVKGEHVALGMLLERTKGAVRTVLVFLSNGLTAAFFAIASYTIAVQWNKLCTQTSAAHPYELCISRNNNRLRRDVLVVRLLRRQGSGLRPARKGGRVIWQHCFSSASLFL